MTPKPNPAATKPIVPKIDGDLVYFNWADYVDPTVFKGFEKEYGVKVIQSNFDSMESMQAKLAAGNRYDIIFPSAQWVQKLIAANQLRPIDHSSLENAAASSTTTTTSPTPGTTRAPRTRSRSRCTRPGSPGARTSSASRSPAAGTTSGTRRRRAARSSSTTATRCSACCRCCSAATLNTARRDELDEIVDKFRSLRPYLRGFSSDDYNNLLAGDAWMHQTWSGDMAALLWQADDPSIFGFEAPREGTPVNSDTYAIPVNAQHPGTALLFIDYMLRPENVEKNINYIGYPMPVHGTEDTYEEIVADYPECKVTVEDLVPQPLLRPTTASPRLQARDAAYTEIKVGG